MAALTTQTTQSPVPTLPSAAPATIPSPLPLQPVVMPSASLMLSMVHTAPLFHGPESVATRTASGTGDDIVIGNNLNDDIAGGSGKLHHSRRWK